MEEQTNYDEELRKALAKSKQIRLGKRKTNKIGWQEIVSELKQKGLYNEFETNPVLEAELKKAIEDEEHFYDSAERIRSRILVNYFLLNLDKEAEVFDKSEEKAIVYKKALDNLCSQRVSGKYDSDLEDKIMLVSMRYYKIVGAPTR